MTSEETNDEKPIQIKEINLTYELFIYFLSLYAIIAYLLVSIFPTTESTRSILVIADNFIVLVFLYDFFRQLYLAPSKLGYLKWGWMDFLSAIPGVYILRILRVGRVIRTSNYLREATGRSAWEAFKKHRAESALLTTTFALFFLILFSSILVLRIEQDLPNAAIQSPEDAIWWSFVTVTTVGYGDEIPASSPGRLIGFILMAGGIILLAVFTGYAASYFNPRAHEDTEKLAEIQSELAEIKLLLRNDPEQDEETGRQSTSKKANMADAEDP
jgi:voltage-gated potassium channel